MADTLWRAIDEEGFGHPVLTPWVMQDFGGGVWNFERNTYYFKVVEAGNQLPYIDRVQMLLMRDRETTILKVLQGEVDHLGERSSLKNLPLLKETVADGTDRGRDGVPAEGPPFGWGGAPGQRHGGPHRELPNRDFAGVCRTAGGHTPVLGPLCAPQRDGRARPG